MIRNKIDFYEHSTTHEVIARYKMRYTPGTVPAEIIFCKVTDGDKVEFVTWNRGIAAKNRFCGDYRSTFLEGLRDFLRRVDADGAGV